jgi:hypothetical protein
VTRRGCRVLLDVVDVADLPEIDPHKGRASFGSCLPRPSDGVAKEGWAHHLPADVHYHTPVDAEAVGVW